MNTQNPKPASEVASGEPANVVTVGMLDAGYDHATKMIIMGCICGVADEVYPARVEKAAEEIMAFIARRRKPNKLWGCVGFTVDTEAPQR